MQVKITIEQTATVDTESITDLHVKRAIERTLENKGDNLGTLWIADWVRNHPYVQTSRTVKVEPPPPIKPLDADKYTFQDQ
jgi:hypothetical protein